MSDKFTNIVVVGQGAMGLLWYHHLSQAKAQTHFSITVSMLASHQNQYADKNNSQKQISSSEYQFTAYQKNECQTYPLIYAQASDIEAADILLLCVKSYQVADAIKNIANILSSRCIVILANNGMGVFEEIASLLSSKQVLLAMLTTHGCLRHAPFNIIHTGLGESDLGLLTTERVQKVTGDDSEHLLKAFNVFSQKKLTQQLHYALPKVTFHQNILHKQWLKLAINCVINPITAIHNIDNGEINNNNKFITQIDSLLTEIIEVASAEMNGLGLTRLVDSGLKSKSLKVLVANVAKATATNCSSMRSDVLAGRKTEIDYINGYIHRLGKKHHIATPENTRLWQTVKSLSKD